MAPGLRTAIFILLTVPTTGCTVQEMARINLDQGGTLACPDDTPTCPTVAPTWSADVSPIVSRCCAGCHAPGGPAASRPLVTYADVYALRSATLKAVYGCAMPPPDDTTDELSSAEREKLLGWLICGAPNN